MRSERLGTILLVGGVAVGLVASFALALGFAPSQLPAALLDIAAYKLTFIAAGGLIAAGAIVRRHVRASGAAERRDPSIAVDEMQSPGPSTERARDR